MEKDIGKIRKNEMTDIVIRIDDFGGKVGLTIREYTKSDRYTGFTKSGTRIPADSIVEFKEIINSIDEEELKKLHQESQEKLQKQDQKKLTSESDIKEEIEEEVF